MSNPSRNTVIESLGVYLPPGVVSTRDVLDGCSKISRLKRFSASRVEKLIGIKQRRLAADTEAASEMARKAIEDCLASSRCQAADIDLLICCSISRYGAPNQYIHEPAISLVLADHFQFRNALTLDIGNGCAGMFTAITVADSFIKAGLIRVALIVSGEHITDLMRNAQKEVTGYADLRFACLTLGDAAAALILKEGPDDGTGFHAVELYTAAQYSEYCIGKPTAGEHGGPIMYTESAKLFDVAENYVIPDTARVLNDLQWGKDELDHIISHQTAQTAIDTLYEVNRLAQREILHEGNVVNNLSDRGNTASTSHFVALWDQIHSGRIKSGARLLFAVQGSGMTIGTAAYTLDDLPDRVRQAPRNGHGKPATSADGRARAIVRLDAPRVRIESLGVAGGNLSGIELAQRAMEDCLARSAYRKEDVEVLIFAGVHRDEFIAEPAIAALIAGRSKVNETGGLRFSRRKTLAFDVCNGSMGFLDACYLGAGMIRSGRVKSVMVVASDIEPNAAHPDWDQLGIAVAGSAVILDGAPDGRTGFGHGVFDSFTDHMQAYASWLASSYDRDKATPRLHLTQHPDLEDIYLKCIPETVEALLKCEGLRMEDVKVILPPQMSSTFVPRLADALQADRCRFVDVGGNGDLASSSLVHAFKHIPPARVADGDVGLVISVGSGLQVGAAAYYF